MKISLIVLACGFGAICSGWTPLCAEDADLDARLREALRQKMEETGAQPPASVQQPKPVKPSKPVEKPVQKPATPVVAAPVKTPVKPAQPAPAAVTAAAQPAAVTSAAAPADDAETEQLREALRARMAQEAAKPSTPTAVAVVKPTVSTKSAPKPPILAEPIVSSLPASKETRLAQLLQQYKADQITPEQYHMERAKIIAEP